MKVCERCKNEYSAKDRWHFKFRKYCSTVCFHLANRLDPNIRKSRLRDKIDKNLEQYRKAYDSLAEQRFLTMADNNAYKLALLTGFYDVQSDR